MFVVWCSGLPGASARPGVFVFFSEWLWFVVGVCPLTLWGSAHVEVSILFFCLVVLPLCCASLLLGGCGWHSPFVADRRCWCFSFGALWLLPALGCLSFGGCVWCLLFGALGFLGLLPGLGCLRLFLLLCLALVLWASGASARPAVFVFFPCVVVLVFVFWRSGASACFAAFLFLLVAAVGMGPTAACCWCVALEASACLGCLCSFCWLRLVFAFLALWGFCRPGVFVFFLAGCGLWCPGVFVFFPWVVVLVFVFWRFGASACGEVSFCFLFWWFCPSVVSLFFLVAVVGIVLCCWSLLLVFLFWCPVASARPGVCLVWRLGSVFVDWCSGASTRPGLTASFGGCDWRLSFGALGLLPALWCSSSSFGWLWFGVGVCLSALWGFRPLWGVFLPFGGCGWRAGASACFAVFRSPFSCCGGLLSFGAGSLLVPSARSVFSFSSSEAGREDLQ